MSALPIYLTCQLNPTQFFTSKYIPKIPCGHVPMYAFMTFLSSRQVECKREKPVISKVKALTSIPHTPHASYGETYLQAALLLPYSLLLPNIPNPLPVLMDCRIRIRFFLGLLL